MDSGSTVPNRLRFRSWIAPASILVLALAIGTVGFADDAYLDLNGDAPRYLMNGVFFHDLVRDAPIAARGFRSYVEEYYARYPALSLGLHPVLPSLLMAPVFALVGVSVPAARLVPLAAFLGAAWLVFLIVSRIYDRRVAAAAMLLFVLSPFAASFSRVFLSEMPALAALLSALYFWDRYCHDGNRRDLWCFTLFALASIYGKQLTVFIVPACALYLVSIGGLRRLLRLELLVAAIIALVLLTPLIAATLRLSAVNVYWVLHPEPSEYHANYARLLFHAMASQISWPVVGLAAIGAARAMWTRDRRSALFVLWVLAFVAMAVLVTRQVAVHRYTVYWIPALCTLAAANISGWRSPALRLGAVAVLLVSMGWEAAAASRVRPEGAGGYEEAARYVARETHSSATVLFSGDIDTGYFVFFVRQHDPDRRLVVLRADKILTTSYMGHVASEERIQRPDEIDGLLRDLGTRFVVIEDRPSESRVLEWLRARLLMPPFVERLRVHARSEGARLHNVDLVVFENVGVPAPNPDARVTIHMPAAGMKFDLRLGDVLAGPGVRDPKSGSAPPFRASEAVHASQAKAATKPGPR